RGSARHPAGGPRPAGRRPCSSGRRPPPAGPGSARRGSASAKRGHPRGGSTPPASSARGAGRRWRPPRGSRRSGASAGPRRRPRRLGELLLTPSAAPAAGVARMVAAFRQGLRDLQPIWEQALAAGTLGDLYPLGDLAPDEFAFPAELWARVVYDFLLAYRFRVLHREHLLRSLVPLYLGRMAALSPDAPG